MSKPPTPTSRLSAKATKNGCASHEPPPASPSSPTPPGARIHQLRGNSLTFEPPPFLANTDLCFVDGGHSYECVKADTETALKILSPNGVILWDDYSWFVEGVEQISHRTPQNSSALPHRRQPVRHLPPSRAEIANFGLSSERSRGTCVVTNSNLLRFLQRSQPVHHGPHHHLVALVKHRRLGTNHPIFRPSRRMPHLQDLRLGAN